MAINKVLGISLLNFKRTEDEERCSARVGERILEQQNSKCVNDDNNISQLSANLHSVVNNISVFVRIGRHTSCTILAARCRTFRPFHLTYCRFLCSK